MTSSTDRGETWGPAQTVDQIVSLGIHDPQADAFARTSDTLPEPAIDARTGQLYVVWQDARYNAYGEDDTAISTSVQGGLTGTWTVPQPVDLPEDRAGFVPAIKVNALGQVGVDYFSLRHPDDGPDVWPVTRYLRISGGPAAVSSQPGTAPTATFGFSTPTHVAGPFNMLAAPVVDIFAPFFPGEHFVGDYVGMTVDRNGRSFHTFFAQMNCDTDNCIAVGTPTGAPAAKTSPPDPMDVYTNRYERGG